VLGLLWDDVDFLSGLLHVRHALRLQPDGVLALVETKTAASERTIPMPQSVVQALKVHRERQLDQRFKIGDAWLESGFVFASTVGPRSVHATTTGHSNACSRRRACEKFGCTTSGTPPPACYLRRGYLPAW